MILAVVNAIFAIAYGILKNSGLQRLESLIFQASIHNCKNCVHNCEDHSLFDLIYFVFYIIPR